MRTCTTLRAMYVDTPDGPRAVVMPSTSTDASSSTSENCTSEVSSLSFPPEWPAPVKRKRKVGTVCCAVECNVPCLREAACCGPPLRRGPTDSLVNEEQSLADQDLLRLQSCSDSESVNDAATSSVDDGEQVYSDVTVKEKYVADEEYVDVYYRLPLELWTYVFDHLDFASVNSCIEADGRFIYAANRRKGLFRIVETASHKNQISVTELSVVNHNGVAESAVVTSNAIFTQNIPSVFSRLHLLCSRSTHVCSLRLTWTGGSLFDRNTYKSLVRPFKQLREFEFKIDELATDEEVTQILYEWEQLVALLRPTKVVFQASHLRIQFSSSVMKILSEIGVEVLTVSARSLTVAAEDLQQIVAKGAKLILCPLDLLNDADVLTMVREMIKTWHEGKSDVLSIVLDERNSRNGFFLNKVCEGYTAILGTEDLLMKCITRADGDRLVLTDGPCIWNWG